MRWPISKSRSIFSLVSFTTLGFGDILLDEPYRLLSGMMAADGLILFGLTTAFLIEFIRSLHVAQAEADRPRN